MKQNCSEQEMQTLIEDAQIHCLYTEQATGLKLKLLNVLYSGRFVVANPFMLFGTRLMNACYIAIDSGDYIDWINSLILKEFTFEEIGDRKHYVSKMDNSKKTELLLSLIQS